MVTFSMSNGRQMQGKLSLASIKILVGPHHHRNGNCRQRSKYGSNLRCNDEDHENLQMQLREYYFNRVQVTCAKCGRRGTYRKNTLVERFGGSIELPNLLKEIAADYPRQGLQSVAMDPCGALFPDLRASISGAVPSALSKPASSS